MTSSGIEQAVDADCTFTFTFGIFNQTAPWTDVRALTWRELGQLLTMHQVGAKAGTCIVPATFSGGRRTKAEAVQIEVAFLDSDTGTTRDEITAAIAAQGWSAIVASTHSHLCVTTQVKRQNWDKFQAEADHPTPAAFLELDKGYLPRVAAGAVIVDETADFVTFRHQPCPKFRIAVPLQRPWRAEDYPDQNTANVTWKERIEALAAALGLAHDQACTDTSRLFYLPRRPVGGPVPETAVLDGTMCDIFALHRSIGESSARRKEGSHQARRGRGDTHRFVHPETGEMIDLTAWARNHARHFEIVAALQVRRPDIFVGKVADGAKHHIRCINEGAHTQPGIDAATIILNASESTNGGFVYHCRHAHCEGIDRLIFVRKMLEQGWLSPDDLTDPQFQTADGSDDEPEEDVELTEHGVALIFARRHRDVLRYCHSTGAWFVWSGTRWAKNETKLAFHWARRLTAALNRDETIKIQSITGKAVFAGAVERYAQADPIFAVTASTWDSDPWLLGTPGGTVDLRIGQLNPARREDYITRTTAVAPADSAHCPKFLEFLHQATGGDEDLMGFLQRWFGYCLTGITREHALIFVYGPGSNGKGVLLVTISGILHEYATTAAMDTFTVSRGERHPTDLAMLHGARLVMTTETEEGHAWAEARIKALTGGDPITARFMRQDFFTFTPAFKLTVSGNHKPVLRNVDDAARRRLNVVSFLHKPTRPNPTLTEELQAEWPGILRWMIDGCLSWQKDGLSRPKAVLDATAEYFAEQDILTQWIEERCEIDSRFGDTSSNLFASWRAYALSRGEEPNTAKWFSASLERQGYRRDRDCVLFRGRGFRGIRALPEPAAKHWQDGED